VDEINMFSAAPGHSLADFSRLLHGERSASPLVPTLLDAFAFSSTLHHHHHINFDVVSRSPALIPRYAHSVAEWYQDNEVVPTDSHC